MEPRRRPLYAKRTTAVHRGGRPFQPGRERKMEVDARLRRDPKTLDSQTERRILSDLRDSEVPLPSKEERMKAFPPLPSTTSVVGADGDLVSSMAHRLRALERHRKEMESAVKSRDERILELENELKRVRRRLEDEKSLKNGASGMDYENKKLRKELSDIHNFLSDYGLTWVGNGSFPSPDEKSTPSPTSSSSSSPASDVSPHSSAEKVTSRPAFDHRRKKSSKPGGGDEKDKSTANDPKPSSDAKPFIWKSTLVDGDKEKGSKDPARSIRQSTLPFDVEKLKKNVHRMNMDVGDGSSYVPKIEDGQRKLEKMEPLGIALYKNGMVVGEGGAFRPYSWDLSIAFVNDIMDGYFPYEFKDKYPDGIPLRIVDKTGEDFVKLTQEQKIERQHGKMHTIESLTNQTPKAMDEDILIKNMPKRVIRGGRVIDLFPTADDKHKEKRKDGPLRIGDPSLPDSIALREVLRRADEKLQSADEVVKAAGQYDDITVLAVKTAASGQTVRLLLHSHQTLNDARDILLRFSGDPSRQMSFLCPFPRKAYGEDDMKKPLKEIGLFPRANLQEISGM
eukprot:TRINITY_DN1501_c0_g1_i3.p1 TRINITY_DN1501_c0_g1~~TRINITY_DN1501_c0_g1_i3.p1  ORF type:complete len:565 (-),score=172.24 TRINITY_DN1501_c0_g1_i3:214-1908(-)